MAIPTPAIGAMAVLLCAVSSSALADASYHSLAGGDFVQDWSDAALITSTDDWSGVPSIVGYRGDGLTGAAGTDPQTLLLLDAVVDVNANQTNPNTFTTGGLAEFAIANPVVALAGSATARGPSLVLHLDTTGRYNIQVEYNLRDIDGSTDNSIQPVALQYRIGTSGDFTNVPAGFVADASSGPSLATLVTPVSVTLPSAVDNQPQVQLRIITSDAAGADEWIGIDDIFVFGEPPPPPAVTVENVSVVEGNPPGTTTMTFTATLAQAIQDDCDFSVETFDSSPDATATPNVDYTPISLNLSIPAGQTSVTFDVPIIRDTDIEADEVLVIDVYGEPQACDIFGIGDVFGTIIDDDLATPPNIFISDVSLFEGNAGSTQATLTVSLSAPAPAGGVSVDFATANGTASTALGDYAAASGTLDFVAGDDSETITIDLTGDTFFEADETLIVNLSNAVGGNIADGQGQVTILNDDGLPELAIGNAAVVEGTGAGTTAAVFTVSLSGAPAPGDAVSVDYASAAGSAVSGTDFTGVGGTLSFTNGGALAQAISVPVVRDNIDESDETFTVGLGNAVNAQIEVSPGIGTIEDDDTAVVSINSVNQSEGNAGTSDFIFTLSLSTPSASTLEFSVYTTDGSASAGSDYVGIPAPGNTVVFPPLSTTQAVAVTVNGDTTVEADETFNALVLPALAAIEGFPPPVASGIGTIVNDDVLVDVGISDASVTEGTGAGTTNAAFTVTLSAQPPAGSPVTVDYTTAGGTATSGADFAATSGALTFSNGGALTQTISVPVVRDNIDENDEGFVVDITAPAANVTDGQGAGTIVDDDTAVVTIDPNFALEGDSGVKVRGFNVRLSNPADTIRAYAVYTEDVTATAPSDYEAIPMAAPLAVVFNPGETTAVARVSVNGDTQVEQNEVFALNLFDPAVGTPNPLVSGAGLIINDDLPSLSINDVSVIEGSGGGFTTALFTVTLSEALLPGNSVLVNFTTAPGTAVVGDYADTTGTLRFVDDGTVTQVIGVAVIRDNVDEDDEQFFVNLLNAGGATIADGQGTGTIVDDDSALPSIANISVTEGNAGTTSATFTIALSNPSSFPLTYQASTADGTAMAPGDYQGIAVGLDNVSFAPMQTSQTITVDVAAERLVEADETFVLNLRSARPTGGTPAIVATGSATIVNDDVAVLSIDDVSLPEGSGNGTTPFTFTISSSNPSSTPITVGYQTGDGSATAPVDYIAASGTATIPAGATNVPVTVTVIADNLQEPDETYSVTLSAAQGASIGDPVGIGTILDEDDRVPIPALDARSLALLIALMLAIGMAGIARRR